MTVLAEGMPAQRPATVVAPNRAPGVRRAPGIRDPRVGQRPVTRIHPDYRPQGCRVERPAVEWRLTARGVRVVTLAFAALIAASVVVIATQFLAVSDAPLAAAAAQAVTAALR